MDNKALRASSGKGILLVSLVMAAWVSRPASGGQAKDVAMLTDIAGSVVVKGAAPRWQPARLMMLLYANDEIKVADSSAATVVFFGDGHRERLSARTLGSILPTGCQIKQGSKRTVGAVAGQHDAGVLKEAYRQLQTGHVGGAVLRGIRSATSPTARTLSETRTLAERPTFQWTPVRNADRYVVVLLDGDAIRLWQAETPRSELPYPETESALQAGQSYLWKVTALAGNKKIGSSYATFEVLSAEEAARVQEARAEYETLAKGDPQDVTPSLLLAASYQTHRLFDDAISVYEDLARRRPKDPNIRKALAHLYLGVGRLREAVRQQNLAAGFEK